MGEGDATAAGLVVAGMGVEIGLGVEIGVGMGVMAGRGVGGVATGIVAVTGGTAGIAGRTGWALIGMARAMADSDAGVVCFICGAFAATAFTTRGSGVGVGGVTQVARVPRSGTG